MQVGKIALVCGLLKEKYMYSKYRVRSVFYHLQDHKKIIHLKMLGVNNVSLNLSPFCDGTCHMSAEKLTTTEFQ